MNTCSNLNTEVKAVACDIYVPNIVKEMKMRKTIDGKYECMINDDGFWRPCVYDKENRTIQFSE